MRDFSRPDEVRQVLGEGDSRPFGWRPAAVLVAVSLVDRIETNVVPGVLPLLQDEWGFSDTAGGAIPTAGAIAGILVALPAGYLADRVDRTRLLATVVASWSLVIAASGLAISFGMFFATRVVLGAADSLDGPSASSVLADYYPPASRGKVFGYHRLSSFVGGGLGVLLGGLVGGIFGWRAAFLFMIVPGLLVAWWTARLDEPPRGLMDELVAEVEGPVAAPDATDPLAALVIPPAARLDGDDADDGDGGETTGWRARVAELRDLLAVRTVFHVYVGITSLFVGLAGIFFWLPSYYERRYDVAEEAAAALAAVLVLVATIVGTVAGGTLGDRWHRARPGWRIVLAGGGLLAGSAVMPAAFLVGALWLHVAALFPALMAMSLAIPNLSAAVADVLPAARRGIGFGLFSFLTAIGGAMGPLAVGAASDAFGSLETAFLVLVAPIVVGSLVVLGARSTFDADVDAVLHAARRPPAP